MLKLITYPNKILQETLPEFDFDSPIMDPYLLEEEMIKVMVNSNGIGLSGNQVGINARVFVMQTQNLPEIYTPFALFNPELIGSSEELELGSEGCLSFPDLAFKIKRPKYIITKFFDRNNKERIIEFEGIDARCFLHELDHLNGICFTEKVSKLKLSMSAKKQRKNNGRTK